MRLDEGASCAGRVSTQLLAFRPKAYRPLQSSLYENPQLYPGLARRTTIHRGTTKSPYHHGRHDPSPLGPVGLPERSSNTESHLAHGTQTHGEDSSPR